jgi:hypothetical protein
VSSVGPIVLSQPARVGPAWHIAPASALYRKPPTWELPHGFSRVHVPGWPMPPWAAGALVQSELLLPMQPLSMRYAIPKGLTAGIEEIWRPCPISGLELPGTVADEMWLRQKSAIHLMVTPSQLDVTGPSTSLSTVAWLVLLRSIGDGDESFRQLADLAFRLEVVGLGHSVSVDLAQAIAGRWRIGRGLVAAAESGRPWLNPRCIRWIIRELAVAAAAAERGSDRGLIVGMEEAATAATWFPRVFLQEAKPDPLDVLMACWFLHEHFHGADLDANDVNGVMAMMTALGFANGSWTTSFERFASWASVWSIEDGDPLKPSGGWQGTPPSALRAGYYAATGLDVRDWLAGCLLVLLPSWNGADDTSARIDSRPIRDRLPPSTPPSIAATIERQLSVTVPMLGHQILELLGGVQHYAGLGTTPQLERSALYDRPILTFPDGASIIVSAAAFANRSVAAPREVLEAANTVGNRRKVGGAIGRMFETAVAHVIDGLRNRCHVLLGADIDQVVDIGARRGDMAVSSVGATVILECGLQPVTVEAVTGDAAAVDDMLSHYADKLEQAYATTSSSQFWSAVPRLGSQATGYFVVVDDPISFSAAHCARVRELRPDTPDLFVVGIDDIVRLVDLAERGVDFPSALIAWQTSGSRLPFDHHLVPLADMVGQRWTFMFATLTTLAERLTGPAAA